MDILRNTCACVHGRTKCACVCGYQVITLSITLRQQCDSADEILEREMVIGETLARGLCNTLGALREEMFTKRQ